MRADGEMMWECLALAVRGAGRVSPNPMVGAILADRRGRVLAAGYHRYFGGPHAEVECLSRFSGDPRGTTLYVNLEPCAHAGKTPPCTARIIAARIPRVVVAVADPNPLVAGRGIRALRRAGIRVDVGVLASEACELNRHFLYHIQTGRPYVHVKVAQTLDGKIAGARGARLQISSDASQRLVHRWRSTHDAVLVGAGTVVADDPRLDVRLVNGRNPDVVIVDGGGRVSAGARVFSDTHSRRVFYCTTRRGGRRLHLDRLSLMGVIVLEFPSRNERMPFNGLLKELYRQRIGSVLVEGGSEVFTRFIEELLVNELSIFVAPKLLPSGLPAFGAGDARVARIVSSGDIELHRVGADILLQARFSG
jgi:diaminohydroxyphosphoribosylaminopyrimidine deaminase / 5-amino-6-(5-phosphoribosylamino)uracil reductase